MESADSPTQAVNTATLMEQALSQLIATRRGKLCVRKWNFN